MNLISKTLRKSISFLGIDEGIFWASVNKGFGIVRAPISIYFLLTFSSAEEQGLWYTFTSLGVLASLADLGFTSIITQFVSHEFAKLKFDNKIIEGDSSLVDRMMGLIRYSVFFYLKIALVAIIILIGVGFFYYRHENYNVLIAWFAFSVTGGISLLVCLFQTIYQGLDKIKEVQINILLSSVAITLFTCISLALHLKIWALIVGSLTGLLITSLGLFIIAKPFWIQVFTYKVSGTYFFLKETISLQIRYAISFICNYLINFLYIPVTYKYVGASQAGQFGLTISIVSVISSLSSNWLFTKVPKFNILVSRKQFKELDTIVKASILQGLFIQILFSGLFLLTLYILSVYFPSLSIRFLNLKLSFLFALSQVVPFVINGLTLYLRAFKKEPFMWLQVINAIFTLCSIFLILSANRALQEFLYVINIINWVILLPMAWVLFKKKRVEYISRF